MEIKFRSFQTLTQNTTISVQSDIPSNPIFKFDIVEVKPKSPFKTVSVVNCDVKIDFEAPLDYVEPAPPIQNEPQLQKKDSKVLMEEEGVKRFKAFKGKYRRLDGKEVKFDPVRFLNY